MAIKRKKKMIHTSLVVHWLRREPKCPQKSAPGGNKCDHHAIKFPSTSKSAMKVTADTTHPVFTVDVKASTTRLNSYEGVL